jgi:hypothetical protein
MFASHGCGRPAIQVCAGTASGSGFCAAAEHAAIAAMVTGREYQIAGIAAVWRDGNGELYVLPPGGRCREFMRQIDPASIDTEVIIARDCTSRMREFARAQRMAFAARLAGAACRSAGRVQAPAGLPAGAGPLSDKRTGRLGAARMHEPSC